jgi:dienelactone hydrolase
MNMSKPAKTTHALGLEPLESRCVPTLVFLLSGNAFAAAAPSVPTQVASTDLALLGDQAIQLSYPRMNSLAAFNQLANQIGRISKGQPIGLIGFSAGGTIALRLAQSPLLRVTDVLDFYGPPDLASFLTEHQGDGSYRRVLGHLGANPHVIGELSGPGTKTAHIVAAFGTKDTTVLAAPSAASLQRDFPVSTVYYYAGPHGVTVRACPTAYQDFLNHL